MRIGIIGAGGAARSIHILGFGLCPDVEVSMACDADAEALGATGVATTCTDYRDVLRSPDIDAVVVATPNYLHREIVLAVQAQHGSAGDQH